MVLRMDGRLVFFISSILNKRKNKATQPSAQKAGDDFGMCRKVLKCEIPTLQEKAFPNSGTQAGCSKKLFFGGITPYLSNCTLVNFD